MLDGHLILWLATKNGTWQIRKLKKILKNQEKYSLLETYHRLVLMSNLTEIQVKIWGMLDGRDRNWLLKNSSLNCYCISNIGAIHMGKGFSESYNC